MSLFQGDLEGIIANANSAMRMATCSCALRRLTTAGGGGGLKNELKFCGRPSGMTGGGRAAAECCGSVEEWAALATLKMTCFRWSPSANCCQVGWLPPPFSVFFLLGYLPLLPTPTPKKSSGPRETLPLLNHSIQAPCSCWAEHCFRPDIYAAKTNVAQPFCALRGICIKVVSSCLYTNRGR